MIFLLICDLTLFGQANLSGASCDPKYWSSLFHLFWTSTKKEDFVGCGLLYRNKNFSLSPTKEAAAAKAVV